MAFFTWNDTLSVNIKMIDTQHKRLVELVHELFESMTQLKGTDVIGKILDELIDYTKSHFAQEEVYMRTYNYPQIDAHITQHKEFIKTVGEFYTSYKSGQVQISAQVMNFLKDWLINHIQKTDKELGKFLIDKGIH